MSTPENVYATIDGQRVLIPYDPGRYKWNVDPDPDDPICRECYEWRSYPPGQEHFGFTWWRTCNRGWDEPRCDHAHHDTEVWVG